MFAFIYFLIGRELYVYHCDHRAKRMKMSLWLNNFAICLEVLQVLKFSKVDDFQAPFPRHIVLGWQSAGVVILALYIGLRIRDWKKEEMRKVK